MVNILIEGCDGVGKTSAINKMIEHNPAFKQIHLSNPKDQKDGKAMYIDMLHELWHNDNLIYDRAHLSEVVYAPIFRKYSPHYMQSLELLMPEKTILVLLYADPELLAKRFADNFIKMAHIPQIQLAYKEAFENSLLQYKYMLDTTYISIEEVAWRIQYLAGTAGTL